MPKRIFIGSSNESHKISSLLKRKLEEEGFAVEAWWGAFRPGDITIHRLKEISHACDGAVFVFSGDDKILSRDVERDIPRDNVLVEFGLFVSSLGIENCLILKDSSVLVPSDLKGVTYLQNANNTDLVFKSCIEHFKELFKRKSAFQRDASIASDPLLGDIEIGSNPPSKYIFRRCYLGPQGAKGWLGVAQDPSYEDRNLRSSFNRSLAEFIGEIRSSEFNVFISYGPGDGDIDVRIAQSLDTPSLQYLPIDISWGILQLAMKRVGKVANTPLGLHADFEGGLPFIENQIEENSRGRRLFSMLGNTFGNFDEDESGFLSHLERMAKQGDMCLLGVTYKISSELGDVSAMPNSVKEFWSNGISSILAEAKDEVIKNFSRYCNYSIVHNGSFFSSATTIKACHPESGITYGYFRRYDVDEITHYFSQRDSIWELVKQKTFNANSKYGDLLLLLRRK